LNNTKTVLEQRLEDCDNKLLELEAQRDVILQGQEELTTQILMDIQYAMSDGMLTTKEQVFKFCLNRARFQTEVMNRLA